MKIKKYYLSTMAVRHLAFHLLSAIFAVVIVLSNWISYTVVLVLKHLKGKSFLARNITKRWMRVVQAGKRQILQYMRIIVNIILGLFLTKYLVSYHSFVIKTIVTISYQLHLISLNWVVDIPDYSAYLNDSQSFKMITGLLCLLYGYLGLSTQISFIVDLISIFSYPFRALRKICELTKNKLIFVKSSIIDILSIKKKYWLTCPYPDYLLSDSLKIVYICSLPLVLSLIIFLKAYSVLVSSLNLIAETAINIGLNISQIIQETGRVFCIAAGLETENDRISLNKSTLSQRFYTFKNSLKQMDWTPLMKFKKIKQIFIDSQEEGTYLSQQKSFRYFSILSVYENFVTYLI